MSPIFNIYPLRDDAVCGKRRRSLTSIVDDYRVAAVPDLVLRISGGLLGLGAEMDSDMFLIYEFAICGVCSGTARPLIRGVDGRHYRREPLFKELSEVGGGAEQDTYMYK